MQVDQNECRNQACKCLAESGKDFCGNDCEKAALRDLPAGATCQCAHPECNVSAGVPESAVGGG